LIYFLFNKKFNCMNNKYLMDTFISRNIDEDVVMIQNG